MKVVILAGGKGTRMGGLSRELPKPMVEIGGRPMLCHIMRRYARYGFRDFVIALGHRGGAIEQYFAQPAACADGLGVTLVDTGQETATGGRLGRLRAHLGDTRFMMTWGDGIADIDVAELLDFHCGHGRLATVTAVRPPARFGALQIENDRVTAFTEKPAPGPDWINGAFFVLEPAVLDYIKADDNSWEYDIMPQLVRDAQLMAYRHSGFWQCMDTEPDHARLEQLWQQGKAPWRDD